MTANVLQLKARAGPFAEHHRRKTIYSLGGVIRERDEKPETV